MATDTNNQERENLIKTLDMITLSYDTLQIIILAIVLSAVNVNKMKIQLQDQLNDTNYAECLPDTTNIPLITSVMIVYATYTFAQLSQQTLQEQKQISSDINDSKVIAASEGYLASILVFIAALIRLNNIINSPTETTPGEELEVEELDVE